MSVGPNTTLSLSQIIANLEAGLFSQVYPGGASGPVVIVGAGAPAAGTLASDGTTPVAGSIYLRTDGGVGTSAYLKTGASTWTAVGNSSGTFTGNVTGNVTGTLIGGQQDAVVAASADGAVTIAPGTIAITKSASACLLTLAAPTATTHDGYILRFVSTTARAHTVTTPSGKINGGSLTVATFGGAIGDAITLEAYQGVWYTVGGPRNVTIS